MFGSVEISKIEHRLILFATSIIPVLALGFILILLSVAFYEYIFPTPPQSDFSIGHGETSSIASTGEWGAKPTLPVFRICVVLSLTISFILLFYKRVFLSILTFILPIISLAPFVFTIHWRVQEILETTRDLETIDFYKEKGLIEIVFSTLDNVNTVFLGFIITLLFWQISILLRMLIKTLQRKTELP